MFASLSAVTKFVNSFSLLQELANSDMRYKHFWGCICLHLCRKLLGEAAWRDCVGRCNAPAAVDRTGKCTWSNVELVYFGIDVCKAHDWQLRTGNALQARTQFLALEASAGNSSASAKKLKEKLRMARWKFGFSVVKNMYHRMLRKVRERMDELGRV